MTDTEIAALVAHVLLAEISELETWDPGTDLAPRDSIASGLNADQRDAAIMERVQVLDRINERIRSRVGARGAQALHTWAMSWLESEA